MKDATDLLAHFRQRPEMYVGGRSLDLIRAFLDGYSFATVRCPVRNGDDPLLVPREFHDWVAYRLHFYESTSGWCNMIRSQSSSEDNAIDRFFDLLAEFHQRSARVVGRLSFQTTQQMATAQPVSVSLVTYTDDPGFFAITESDSLGANERFHPDIESFENHTGLERAKITIVDPEWRFGV